MGCTLSKDLLPYEKVPLYRTIRDCLQHAYCIVVSIPKAYKFTIGSDSINSLRKTAESIFLAYEDGISIENKLTHLRNAKKYLHNTLITYRIMSDLGQVVKREDYIEQINGIMLANNKIDRWIKTLTEQLSV